MCSVLACGADIMMSQTARPAAAVSGRIKRAALLSGTGGSATARSPGWTIVSVWGLP